MRLSDRSVRTGLTVLSVAALCAVALVGGLAYRSTQVPHGPQHTQAVAVATPAAPRTAAAPEAEIAAEAAPPGVEMVPEAESPLPIELRKSVGHAAGLNKVKDPLRLVSSAAYAIDIATGEVLVKKNEDAILPMASLTKMMTGLLTVEAKLPMEQIITITEDDVDNERHSRSRLRVGTTLTREEALHLALMSSENRAAHALGRTFPGGLGQFVNAMNNRAKQLGMKSTTYSDPTGLSSKNESTAHDLALLATAASRQPLLREYSTTPRHQVALGGKTLQYNNSNRLVKNPKWDIVFQKTGYIIEAGMCITMNTRINGRNVVMVLLDATDKNSRLADAERVKRWVLAQAGADSMAIAKHTPGS
ncbi:MAG: peptidase D-alanyl-D-alanine [Ramlibacter sp.]|nr:peptidase D-alanyl-D-alanine [Ramlibacter sp.]